ncbi:MAG TPA: hypothetical protein VGI64_20650 [Streptosporangiaceae bacterium]
MSGTAIVILIVVILVVVAVAAVAAAAQRRRRLQQRFGPEYDRAIGEHQNRLKAEAELTQREKRVRQLELRPLSEQARDRYAAQWTGLQEQFVDAPQEAVAASHVLVSAVMSDRGYPTQDHEQMIADLSVDHANTLARYRAAEEISQQAVAGTASTEELRQAMIHYRALVRELLGATSDGSDTAGTRGDPPADDATPADPRAATSDPAAADRDATADPATRADDTAAADGGVPVQRRRS